MPMFHNPLDNPNGFHFMGSMPYEEFIRRFNNTQGKQQPRQKRPPKQKRTCRRPAKDTGQQNMFTGHTDYTDAMTKEDSAFDWDKLMWQPLYTPYQVQYSRDIARNELTITVPHYHSETYRIDELMQGYIRYKLSQHVSYQEIMSSPVAYGTDFTQMWQWLCDVGRFPYPLEECLARPGYIDLKKTLKQ